MRSLALLWCLLLASACGSTPRVSHAQVAQVNPTGQDFELIERGHYLTLVGDCAACHTDPADPRPFAGGRAIQTPFGSVLAANITPDVDTGIGSWSDAEFDAAVRRGVQPDGSRLYPAMPYLYYARMSADDVHAIRAYLSTVMPVHKPVHSDQLPFPFSIRSVMRVWDALYFSSGEFHPDVSRSVAWNRGAYLVQGAGHCGACHTPKNFLGGDESSRALQGYSLQGWFAPDITNDARLGLGHWSAGDIVTYLRTGHNRFAGAAGPMSEEVADSSSHWTQGDLEAVAEYLKDEQSASPARRALAAGDPMMQAGAAIYEDVCSACHAGDGRGVPFLIPSLVDSPAVAAREPTTLLRVVLHGARTVATAAEPTAPQMPAYGWQLSDEQVAAVTTFIRNSWGHASSAVSASDVVSARHATAGP